LKALAEPRGGDVSSARELVDAVGRERLHFAGFADAIGVGIMPESQSVEFGTIEEPVPVGVE
jgi:hypothetical protein